MNRIAFLKNLAFAPAFTPKMITKSSVEVDDNINHMGPKKGYSPQIGSMISMLDWISNSVISYNKNLSIGDLDFVFDENANSIGAMMMHVAATEVIYQDITFNGLEDFSKDNKVKWNIAMDLGKTAQEKIKGNTVDFYKQMYNEVRATTKKEMKLRDDKWLLSGETKSWDWNNYTKWFHVAEHYANHRGQMTWISKRLPKK